MNQRLWEHHSQPYTLVLKATLSFFNLVVVVKVCNGIIVKSSVRASLIDVADRVNRCAF